MSHLSPIQTTAQHPVCECGRECNRDVCECPGARVWVSPGGFQLLADITRVHGLHAIHFTYPLVGEGVESVLMGG